MYYVSVTNINYINLQVVRQLYHKLKVKSREIKQNMRNIESILNRLKDSLNIKNDTELAKYMNLSSGTIPNWRKRNKIPYEEIFTICENEKIDIKNIFYGDNKENIQNGDNHSGIQINGNNGTISNIHINTVSEMDQEICKAIKQLKQKRKEYYFFKINAELLEEDE